MSQCLAIPVRYQPTQMRIFRSNLYSMTMESGGMESGFQTRSTRAEEVRGRPVRRAQAARAAWRGPIVTALLHPSRF